MQDIVTKEFGRWQVLCEVPNIGIMHAKNRIVAQCSCGFVVVLRRRDLTAGKTLMCRSCRHAFIERHGIAPEDA